MFLKKIYPPLEKSLEKAGLEKATDFQKKSISRIKSGGDLVALAPEGKGKTIALVDVVIGVPERISELLSIEGINLAEMKYLAIDDADTLMHHGMLSHTHRILESLPHAQLIVFGREKITNIERYADKFMRGPQWISG